MVYGTGFAPFLGGPMRYAEAGCAKACGAWPRSMARVLARI